MEVFANMLAEERSSALTPNLVGEGDSRTVSFVDNEGIPLVTVTIDVGRKATELSTKDYRQWLLNAVEKQLESHLKSTLVRADLADLLK